MFLRTQPIAEPKHALDLRAALREYVQVHARRFALEKAMFEPLGFAEAEVVTGRLEPQHVSRLVPRVRHDENDVDHRLRAAPRDRRRTRMVHGDRSVPQRRAKLRLLSRIDLRPRRIVRVQFDNGCGLAHRSGFISQAHCGSRHATSPSRSVSRTRALCISFAGIWKRLRSRMMRSAALPTS